MDISKEQIQELALKWMKGEASPAEEAQLFAWYNENQGNAVLVEDASGNGEAGLQQRMLRNLAEQTGAPFVQDPAIAFRRHTWLRIAAAACVLVLAGAYLWQQHTRTMQVAPTTAVATPKDLAPGSDQAILTLANGKQVILNETSDGTIGQQEKVAIIKAGGQVSYVDKGSSDNLVYNTITTPRKGQYHIVLADGTAVWLDAESSIRFPASFTGADRTVEISGQAYFEVAGNPAKPFHVKVPSNNMNISVLGTHFNIMAYGNEAAVKTTLLEGSVRVQTAQATTILQPGQQAQVKQQGAIQLVKAADVTQVMAWKNGMFSLGGTPIEEIMRQVSRWYDAEIVYQGDISRLKFSGEVSRKRNVSELLQILEATGTVQFKVAGKKITVMPNT